MCSVCPWYAIAIFFSSFFFTAFLDGLAKDIFNFFSNYCFKRVWPRSELLIWYAVCFQAMSFREHLQPSSSATANIVSITTTTMTTELDRVVTYHVGVLSIKSHDPWSCDICSDYLITMDFIYNTFFMLCTLFVQDM